MNKDNSDSSSDTESDSSGSHSESHKSKSVEKEPTGKDAEKSEAQEPKKSRSPDGRSIVLGRLHENVSKGKVLPLLVDEGSPERKKRRAESPPAVEVVEPETDKNSRKKRPEESNNREKQGSKGESGGTPPPIRSESRIVPEAEKRRDRERRREYRDRSISPRRKSDRDRRRSRSRSRSRGRYGRRRRSRSPGRTQDNESTRKTTKDREKEDGEIDEPKKKDENGSEKQPQRITERQRRTVDLLTSRTGGAYIPPAKLRMLQAEITDKSSAAYQRIAWEALKKSIHGYINKVNVDNIGIITRELLKENIIRGRGLLCRSIIQAQAASPTFTHVYAALVAIINSKFPNIGELLLKRLVIQFKRGFRRNDKGVCISSSRFIAHLVNQRVAHEILALEILTLLVETPTDDSVEVAIAFLKECGMKLTEVSAKGVNAIFEMLKNILHEGKLDKRVQYMIEVVFQVRKDGFKDHQSVIEALELVEEDEQFTHLIMLDEATDSQDSLNVFKFDDKYETNEDKYKGLSKELLGSDASDSENGSSGSGSDDSDDEDEEEKKRQEDIIIDNTETNLVALRRTIYLTIHSSLDYEECAHKLMKMELKPGQEMELCHMFLDCCAEQRTYEKFFGLLAQRFCMINKIYIQPFEEIFRDTYHTTHRLDTNRLRNVSKFFAHLLFTDAIGWDVLDCIRLNEEDTTSSSRIFIKILFQELAEYMGLAKLNDRLKDVTLAESFAGLFPRDNPRNTRFAINFFTSIGLGGLTDELREFLKNAPKSVPAINQEILGVPESSSSPSSSSSSSSSSSPSSSSSSSSSSSTSSSSSSSSSESDSSSSSSDSDENPKKKRKQRTKPIIKKKTLTKKKKRKEPSSSSSSEDEEQVKSSRKKKNDKKKKQTKKVPPQNEKRTREDNEKNGSKKDRSNKATDKPKKPQRAEVTEPPRKDREKDRSGKRDREEKAPEYRCRQPSPDVERRRNADEYRQDSRRKDRDRHRDESKDHRKERRRDDTSRSSRGISKERG